VKLSRTRAAGSLALAGALALAGCGTDDNTASPPAGGGSDTAAGASIAGVNCATGTITASGSSAQKNAMDEWVKRYQQACSGSTINYQSVGSGAGIQQFTAGQTAFAGSDSALKSGAEQQAADARCAGSRAINLPMVVGPVAVAYNLPGVDELNLNPQTLAGIFNGSISTWNDPAIAALNPGARLPSSPIQAFHRSDSSGTTENFTKYLAAAAPDVWTVEAGKDWKAPGGQGAKGNEGVTQGVDSTESSIGYVELSFATNAGLGVARIDNGGGQPVELTTESVGKAVEAAKLAGTGNDLKLTLDYATKAPGAYPILLVTYEITCEKGLPAEQAALTKSFLDYTASPEGQQVLEGLGYSPLPDTIRSKVATAVEATA